MTGCNLSALVADRVHESCGTQCCELVDAVWYVVFDQMLLEPLISFSFLLGLAEIGDVLQQT